MLSVNCLKVSLLTDTVQALFKLQLWFCDFMGIGKERTIMKGVWEDESRSEKGEGVSN